MKFKIKHQHIRRRALPSLLFGLFIFTFLVSSVAGIIAPRSAAAAGSVTLTMPKYDGQNSVTNYTINCVPQLSKGTNPWDGSALAIPHGDSTATSRIEASYFNDGQYKTIGNLSAEQVMIAGSPDVSGITVSNPSASNRYFEWSAPSSVPTNIISFHSPATSGNDPCRQWGFLAQDPSNPTTFTTLQLRATSYLSNGYGLFPVFSKASISGGTLTFGQMNNKTGLTYHDYASFDTTSNVKTSDIEGWSADILTSAADTSSLGACLKLAGSAKSTVGSCYYTFACHTGFIAIDTIEMDCGITTGSHKAVYLFKAASWSGSSVSFNYSKTKVSSDSLAGLNTAIQVSTANIENNDGPGLDALKSLLTDTNAAVPISLCGNYSAGQTGCYPSPENAGNTFSAQKYKPASANYSTMPTLSIANVGHYYASSDEIDTWYTSGGDHESPYIGAYNQVDQAPDDASVTNVYSLSTKQPVVDPTNCPTSTPYFENIKTADGQDVSGKGAIKAAVASGKIKKGDYLTAQWSLPIAGGTCAGRDRITPVYLYVEDASATPPSVAGGAGDTGSTGSSGDLQEGCTFQFTNPLTWVICPVVDLMTQFAKQADKIVTGELYTDPNGIFCAKGSNSLQTQTCDAYYKAWQVFRNIALGLMIIGGLVMLTAQALGYELLDAYTIRKVLPRLLIAAVGITLSWPLMKFLVVLSDDLGYGIRGLIYSPFAHLSSNFSDNLGANGLEKLIGGLAVPGAFAAWIVFGGPAALLSYMGTAVLAILVAVIVLILRQVAITLMIIVAPIAIIAFILPNTQKTYHLWWESFSKALLMFPIIAGFIASGRVFAAIANTQAQAAGSNVNGLLFGTIGLFGYFAPYFMIPFTFKMAGGAVSRLGGLVNDRSSGAFDRLRNGRKETRAKRVKAAKSGGMYRNDHALGRSMNKIGNWTVDFPDTATAKFGERRGLNWAFGRRSRQLNEGVAHATLEHSRKAAQHANLHYSSGRAIAGLHHYALNEFKNKDGTFKSKAHQEAHDTMKANLDKQFGIKNADGSYKTDRFGNTVYRAARGEADVKAISHIYKDTGKLGGQNTRYAAFELESKETMLGSFKGPGNEETQRADLETVGLLAAAQAGRLEDHEIADSTQRAIEGQAMDSTKGGSSGGFAFGRDALLRDVATPKRVEQARGHGGEFFFDEETGAPIAMSVYENPTSDAAQKSWGRISAQELAGGKSEAIDSLHDTIVYAASDVKHKWEPDYVDPDTGKRGRLVPEKEEYDLPDGTKGERYVRKDDAGLAAAKAARERLKYIGGYAAGDSGVGIKIQKAADGVITYDARNSTIASQGMGDLSFGARALDQAQQGGGNKPEPEPEQP